MRHDKWTLRALAAGAATYAPGLYQRMRSRSTGGTDSAMYCYGVWLKHLAVATTNGLVVPPDTVAELGPGDSLGTGIAALLTGARAYFAFDVIEYASPHRNLLFLDELLRLLQSRAPVPNRSGWPNLDQYLDRNGFPTQILTDDILGNALDPDRVSAIRHAITSDGPVGDISVKYVVPWSDASLINDGTVDFVFSHSVMQCVDNVPDAYGAVHRWLRPGGLMSHQIDLSSMGTTQAWNGHWAYSDRIWRLVRGRREYYMNREPHSSHIAMIEAAGFRIVCDLAHHSETGLRREEFAPEWKSMSEDDARTRGAFIQARRT